MHKEERRLKLLSKQMTAEETHRPIPICLKAITIPKNGCSQYQFSGVKLRSTKLVDPERPISHIANSPQCGFWVHPFEGVVRGGDTITLSKFHEIRTKLEGNHVIHIAVWS